jgi:hypothetical protein
MLDGRGRVTGVVFGMAERVPAKWVGIEEGYKGQQDSFWWPVIRNICVRDGWWALCIVLYSRLQATKSAFERILKMLYQGDATMSRSI